MSVKQDLCLPSPSLGNVTQRCYSSILLHPVGLHAPTIIVPSGNDFPQAAMSYVLAMSLYELHGSCCSPFRKYLLFGKTRGPNLNVDAQLFRCAEL